MKDLSFVKLFVLYNLFVMSKFNSPLLSKQLKNMLDESRIAQHIVSFIFIFVLIQAFTETNDVYNIFNKSVLIYVGFVLSQKLDLQWYVMFMAMLLLYTLYENFLEEKEKNLKTDNVLDIDTREQLLKESENKKKIITSAMFGLMLIGVIIYADRKQDQYGGGYNMTNFFFY